MAFSPHTRVYLLDTPLDNKYKNELLFDHLEGQESYFQAHIKHTIEDATYQRKDSVIKINKHIDELWDSNYVMYQNENFTDKWFYAFITKMEWLSDHSTAVYIETDVFQTWLFDIEIQESFVVREHVADDTIGKHLVDEQLEIGEYIMEEYAAVGQLGASWFIVGVSDNTPMGSSELVGNRYGRVPTGLTYWPFTNNATGISYLKDMIQAYTDAGKAEAIIMIFTVPELIIESTVNDPEWHFGLPIQTDAFYGLNTKDITKRLASLSGYVPKNNKMFVYPYKFLYLSNSNGMSANYRYEDFPTNTMNFTLFGSVCPNPKVMMCPTDYRSTGLNYEYGLTLDGFPLGSWTTDMYAAWIASNGATTAVTLAGAGIALVGGLATMNPLAIAGGAVGVAAELAQIHQAAIQPDQAKGQVGAGNVRFGDNSLDFYYAHMSIKPEYAKRIDNFFSMYGYKVNTLKVPELRSRSNWNYVQTIDINIVGALPVEDMVRLKRCFDEGITLWHTDTYFLDYSQTNTKL